MDTVYRIYTKACGLREICRIEECAAEYFKGFTMFGGTGHWRGVREDCLVIEILCEGCTEDRDNVLRIASWIKTTFNQESVAITESQVKVYTVGRSL